MQRYVNDVNDYVEINQFVISLLLLYYVDICTFIIMSLIIIPKLQFFIGHTSINSKGGLVIVHREVTLLGGERQVTQRRVDKGEHREDFCWSESAGF